MIEPPQNCPRSLSLPNRTLQFVEALPTNATCQGYNPGGLTSVPPTICGFAGPSGFGFSAGNEEAEGVDVGVGLIVWVDWASVFGCCACTVCAKLDRKPERAKQRRTIAKKNLPIALLRMIETKSFLISHLYIDLAIDDLYNDHLLGLHVLR